MPSFCGTEAYLAPEMILRLPYSASVDFWQYGCFVYELYAGRSPFWLPRKPRKFIRENILNGVFAYPSVVPEPAKGITGALLQVCIPSSDLFQVFLCLFYLVERVAHGTHILVMNETLEHRDTHIRLDRIYCIGLRVHRLGSLLFVVVSRKEGTTLLSTRQYSWEQHKCIKLSSWPGFPREHFRFFFQYSCHLTRSRKLDDWDVVRTSRLGAM